MLYSLGERRVEILGDNWFIAENATVIGSVEIHNNVGVWFNAVIRGDNERIVLGEGSNVQDAAVLHTDPGIGLTLGKYVTVGHKAMLHGCTIGDRCLIGMNAVLLNNAHIGANCIVGANALVTEGKSFPDGSLIVGAPARVARRLSDEEIDRLREPAAVYIDKIQVYKTQLRVQPVG